MESEIYFQHQELQEFATTVFLKCGFTESNARLSAKLLTRADLRGVDSHGVARLSGYVRLWQAGRLNAQPTFYWESRFPTQASLNANASIGFVSAHAAMEKAIEMAMKFGVGMVAVKNSNHFGIAGQYALQAADVGLIGMAMTNASPLVAPTFSTERMLGTNPIAIAVPGFSGDHFVLDMATTTAANGKLEILQRKKEKAPLGWIQSKNGSDSENPEELKNGGALKPLGSFPELSSHKGYGLGAMVDIFSGVLSGANFGPWVPPFVSFLPLAAMGVGEGIGHFLMAFRPDGFLEKSVFLERMKTWSETIRKAKPIANQKVMVHGDLERQIEIQRSQQGIPLLPEVLRDLEKLALEFDIAPLSILK